MKMGGSTMKMLTFNVKNVLADMKSVTVKVPATVDGKAIFETCYPWQATFIVTLWLYYCVAFEAAQYLAFVGHKSTSQKFHEMSLSFYNEFVNLAKGKPEDVPCSQCCQVLVIDSNEDWNQVNRGVIMQLRKIAASMADFMEANKMDTHAVKDAQYVLNNI